MRVATALLVALGFLVTTASAQSEAERRDQRRHFVEGLLRTIVDSQTGRPQQPAPPAAAPRHPRPGPSVTSAKLRDVQVALNGFSEEADGLIAALRHEERYSSALRPLLADALRVKASSDVVLQRSRLSHREDDLIGDVEALDQQWRVLSHQLGQVTTLGRTCQTHMQRLDQYDERLCQLLDIAPQLDRAELMGVLAALGTNVQNLLEDIALDVGNTTTREQLLAEGRRLPVQVDQVAATLMSGTRANDVSAPYKQVYDQWRPFAAKLRAVPSVSLARSLHRIDRLHRRIHELLWMKQAMDRSVVAHFAASLGGATDRLLAEVPLGKLLTLPRPQDALANLVELRNMSRAFSKSAAGNAALDDLLWDYRLLDVQWRQVADDFGPLADAAITAHLAGMDGTMVALRESLSIRPVLDKQQALALAGSVDELAVLMERGLTYYLARSQYASQVRSQMLARSKTFHEAAHHLHEDLAGNVRPEQLRQRCLAAADGWRQLSAYLPQLRQQDRAGLSRTEEQIIPKLVKLQMMLAY